MRIVFSLTSIQRRYHDLHNTIASLRSQTRKADMIYITIGWADRDAFLRTFRLRGPDLTFVFIERDLGPITKICGALKREADGSTVIITVDDDINYDPRLLEELMGHAQAYPNAAIGYSGSICGKFPSLFGAVWPTWSTGIKIDPSVPTQMNTIAGFAGVCYRRRFFGAFVAFHSEIKNYINDANVRRHDDLILSHLLAKRHVPLYIFATSLQSKCREVSKSGLSYDGILGSVRFCTTFIQAYWTLNKIYPWDALSIPLLRSVSFRLCFICVVGLLYAYAFGF